MVDLLPVQLDVAGRGAVHVLDRRYPAQHLLDGDRDEPRLLDQTPQLVRVLQQRVHAAADHVARRLVAADEDQQRLLQQRIVVEPLAVDLGMHERAHQIVLQRPRAAIGDDLRVVVAVFDERAARRASWSSGAALADKPAIRSSDQRSSMSWSSWATPSRSPITIIGSGAAMSRTKSNVLLGAPRVR